VTGKDIVKITINLVVIYVLGGLLLAGVYAKTSPVIFIKNKEEKEAALQKMMPAHLKITAPSEAVEKVLGLLPEGAEPGKSEEAGAVVMDFEHDLYQEETAKLMKKLKKAGSTALEEYSENKVVKVGDWEPLHKHAEHYKVTKGEELSGYIVETYGKGYSSYINVLVAVGMDFKVRKINVLHHGETPGLGDEIELAWFKDKFKGKDAEHLEVIKGETEDKIQAITGATISTRAVTNGVRDGVEMLMKKYTESYGEEETEEVGSHGG
jgi:electron transport complex protein RnfG